MDRFVAIVQARMGSSRLPGKVLRKIAGRPMLQHVVERLVRARGLDDLVIATTASPSDAPLVEFARSNGYRVAFGNEDDVCDRYLSVARETGADVVVRVTGDCPLIDPTLSGDVIAAYRRGGVDYASNWIVRTFPRGADTEAFSLASFEEVARKAATRYEREHATPYYYFHPEEFRMASVEAEGELRRPDLRLCVDTEDDLRLIRTIFDRLGGDGAFSMLDAVRLIDSDTSLAVMNAHVEQKPVER